MVKWQRGMYCWQIHQRKCSVGEVFWRWSFFIDFAAPSVDFDAYRTYAASAKRNLSNKDSYKVGEGLYRSLINDVSLLEFTSPCLFFCGANHRNCQECRKLLNFANDILHHGSHGPGILLEKLLGPWKLLENDFLLENSLNLEKQCLNFMKKSLNTWGYSKVSSFWHEKIEKIASTSKISWETHRLKKRPSFL